MKDEFHCPYCEFEMTLESGFAHLEDITTCKECGSKSKRGYDCSYDSDGGEEGWFYLERVNQGKEAQER